MHLCSPLQFPLLYSFSWIIIVLQCAGELYSAVAVMAGNDWVNSYLEAILDVGPRLDDAKALLLLRERGHFSPTHYFVKEVITGFDETDLYRSWIRAAATRNPQERNTRLDDLEFGAKEEAGN